MKNKVNINKLTSLAILLFILLLVPTIQLTCYNNYCSCSIDGGCEGCLYSDSSYHRSTDYTTYCQCDENYYDTGSPTCTACPSTTCATCDASGCLTCNTNQNRQSSVVGGVCLCQDGYFDTYTKSEWCQECKTGFYCKTCSSNVACDTCDDTINRVLSSDACVCKAQTYYSGYSNGACLSCFDHSCDTCTGGTSCATCSTSDNRLGTVDSSTGKCLCQDRYYDDGSSKDCKACHYSCLTCSSSTTCLTCDSTTDFRSTISAGKCVCMDRYYEIYADQNPVCNECHFSCGTCSSSNLPCTTCDTATSYRNSIDGGTGWCTCPTLRYYESNSHICGKCYFSCKACTSTSACTDCDSTKQRVYSGPYCDCQTKYYSSGTLEECQACQYSCATCTIDSACATCNSGLYRVYDSSTHYCKCDTRWYDSGTSSETCLQCHHSCLTCSGGASSNCLTCQSSDYRVSSPESGYCPCVEGYVDDGSSETCDQCQYSCKTCTTALTICLTCNADKHRKTTLNGAQQCDCADKYYDVSGYEECSACSYTCKTCSGSASYCTSCESDRTYNSLAHTCTCPTQLYYDLSGTEACQSCHYSCLECSGSLSTQCTACDTSASINRQFGSSQCTCIDHYMDNGNTMACQQCSSYTCQRCDNDKNICSQCDSSKYRELSSDSSVHYCICSVKYYDVGDSKELCKLCESYTCATCVTQDQCATCNTDDMHRKSSVDPVSHICLCDTHYYDDGDESCESCQYSCLTCSSLTSCSSCDSSKHRIAGGTYCDCDTVNQYFDDEQGHELCIPCDYRCATCNGYHNYQCLTCTALNHRTITGSHTCPCDDYFYDDGSSAACQPCHYSCKTCSGPDIDDCLSCTESISTTHRVAVSSGYCKCETSYYDDGSTVTCLKCHYSCWNCQSGSHYYNCIECKYSPYLRTLSTNECDCPDHYYDDGANMQCQVCSHGCYTCTGSNSYYACTSCRTPETTYHRIALTVTIGECICEDGYYDDGSSDVCQECHYSCKTCSASNAQNKCTTCSEGSPNYRKQVDNGYCYCVDGYYDVSNYEACEPCDYTCWTCSGTANTCLTCNSLSTNRVYDSGAYTCLCEDGFYDGSTGTTYIQTCYMCHYSCNTCTSSSTYCTSCPDSSSYFRATTPISNACPCLDGYYDDGSSKICQKCHYSCKTCSAGDDAYQCTSCPDLSSGMKRVTAPQYGYCPCQNGYYDSQTNSQQCVTCNYVCATCSGPLSSDCSTCSDSLRSLSYNCQCPSNYFDVSGDSICHTCHYSCLTCSNPGTLNYCLTCLDSSISFRSKSTAVGSCSCISGYYDDGSSPVCKKCHYSCQTCTDANSCSTCDSSAHRVMNGGPYCDCDTSYSDVSGQETCEGTCHYSCNTCSGTTSTNCQSCFASSISNRVYDSSLHTCSCIAENYYDESGNYKCLQCHYSCATCSNSQLSTACATCPSQSTSFRNILVSSGSTQCVCIDSYYDDGSDTVCQECYHSCLTCSAGTSSSCISCPASSNRLSTSLPSCPCEDGYYDVGLAVCAACHYSCMKCTLSGYSYDCTACDTSKRTYSLGYCLCETGYYDDGANEDCLACHYTCWTCSGSADITSCSSCPDSSTYHRISTKLPSCPCENGYYDDGTKTCQLCGSNCVTCSTGPALCTSCQTNEFAMNTLSGGSCVCADGYYAISTTLCAKCDASCGTCQTTSTNCLTCPSQSTTYRVSTPTSGNCGCITGYYSVSGTQICQKCYYQCYTCSDTSTKCTSCSDYSYSHRVLTSYTCPCDYLFYNEDQNSVCERCHYSCVTCSSYGSDKCLLCATTKYVTQRTYSGGKCLCTGSYYDDGTDLYCDACHFSCLTCTGNAKTQCSSCGTDSTVNRQTLQSDNTCICKVGYYDNSQYTNCLSCHYSCLTCVVGSGANQCTSCPSSTTSHRLTLSSGYCLCQDGYYDLSGYQYCQACLYSCLTCSGSSTTCITCPASSTSHRVSTPASGSCSCLSGYYDQTSVQNCQKCSFRCLTCTSESFCLTCNSTNNYRATTPVSGACDCLEGYYEVTDDPVCKKCHHSCKTCSLSNLASSCTSCSSVTTDYRSSLSGGYCNCLQGYYDDGTNTNCQKCHYSCYTCLSISTCDTCQYSLITYRSGVLGSLGRCNCLDGYYDDGLNLNCASCHHSCATCVNSYTCLTCPSDTNMNRISTPLTNGLCSCKSGYIENGNAVQCVLLVCHYSCLTCTASNNAYSCETCGSNRGLSTYSSCLCVDGYYDSSADQACMECGHTCKTCSNANQCLTCPSETTYHRNQYLNTNSLCGCMVGYYDDGTNKACQECSYSCYSCSGAGSTSCLSCPDQSTTHRTFKSSTYECVCVDGYYDNGAKICIKCDYSCLTCTNGLSCSSCSTTTTTKRSSISSTTNLCVCDDGYYDNGTQTQQCSKCNQTCNTCSSSSVCLTCYSPDTTYRISTPDTSGLCPCKDGYYDTSVAICSTCSSQCKTCSSQNFCTSCYSNRTLNEATGQCTCQSTQFLNSSSLCQDCNAICATCAQAIYCTSCSSSQHRYLNQSSLCECSSGYFDSGDPQCVQCHYSCKTCNNPSTCLTCPSDTTLHRETTPNSNNSLCNCLSGYSEDQLNPLQCVSDSVSQVNNDTKSFFEEKGTIIIAGSVAGSTALGVGSTLIVKKIILNRAIAKVNPSNGFQSLSKGSQLTKNLGQNKVDMKNLTKNNKPSISQNNKSNISNNNHKLKRIKKVKKQYVNTDDSIGVLVE